MSDIFDMGSTPMCVLSYRLRQLCMRSHPGQISVGLLALQLVVHTGIVSLVNATVVNITHPMIGSVRLLRPKSGSPPLGEIPRTADLHCLSLSYPGGQAW
ncbi:hypothetical protein BDV24DRAFT_133604 [Aspergillus arachidicola]|uniref:Uncharacterized protein n=1 Tax=Aspergillus arachidicola TaxID=656916 RepID=A0A5N6Y5D6_9EURO|nr:hypothetical protein BDV24DRAFT_133604 [Aspergillus arachidicola]